MKNLAACGQAREGGTRDVSISGEPAQTRIQDPRLKRAVQAVTTEDDRVRPSDTIPLKSCNIFFLPL